MAWDDRLRKAQYESPTGTVLTFDYEDVGYEFTKNGAVYDFPDEAGSFVQDLGRSDRRIPLRIIVWGENYDFAAEDWMDALGEPGMGRLSHPMYGVIDVIPFGPISRRDNLKTEANQATIEVTFFETIGAIFPALQLDPALGVVTAVDEYNKAASDQLKQNTNLETTPEQSQLKGPFQLLLDSVDAELGAIADSDAAVKSQFEAVRDSINASIDTLIGDPLTLAFQSSILIQAPSRALTSIAARLDAYGNLLQSVTAQSFTTGLGSAESNKFHSANLFAMTYVTGSVLSSLNNQFQTKTDAISAADVILSQMDNLVVWRDDQFEALGEIDTGEAYQQLLEAVGLAAGFLVEISFTLKQERVFTLTVARNFLELCAELYGGVDDDALNFFIDSNALSGSEIIEIPIGRDIVYYV